MLTPSIEIFREAKHTIAATVKKHLEYIHEKLAVEWRNAARTGGVVVGRVKSCRTF